MKINREKFFSSIRRSVFSNRISKSQMEGMGYVLDVWEKSVFTDLRWLGYMLGTAYVETAHTMQPVHEYGGEDYFTRMYDINGERPGVARRLGNLTPGDGIKYAGRGFVQLTGKNNYQRAGKLLDIDLVNNPDLAMEAEVAAKIMFEGMTDADIVFEDKSLASGDGTDFSFTGKTLEDYFDDEKEDWVNARRIINGTDHAEMIGNIAKRFYDALEVLEVEGEKEVEKEIIAPPLTPPAKKEITGKVLKRGDKGDEVKELQELLDIDIDGDFGKWTDRSVKLFQRLNGLVEDGIVGPLTWKILRSK